uniref:sulfhydryl oxidase 1-like n=1 Tax=Styela clava TaxID=7725 RepID=UPI0019396BF7|nr:sulfhydryl oxidase 1-like [Styela clava]
MDYYLFKYPTLFVFVLFWGIDLAAFKAVQPAAVGLYGTEDNVTILTASSFEETVFDSPYIWIIEFYSSWCGHCQEFAPTFKAFAKDIAEWQNIIRIGVLDCPDEDNRKLCLKMEIRGYPEMRIFHPHSNTSNSGEVIDARSIENLRNVSVKNIEKDLDSVSWSLEGIPKPTFDFASFEDINQFLKAKSTPHYLAVIIEEESSSIGKEVILDISSCKNISARRVISDSIAVKALTDKTGVTINEFPTVILMSKDGKAQEITVELRRRSFYTYKLRNLPGVGDPKTLPKQVLPVEKDRGSYVDWKTVDRSKVYIADIESGLRYALTIEIGLLKVLEDETLDATKSFVGTIALLSEHIPMQETTKNFLVKLISWLAGKEKVYHREWQQRMEIVEDDSFLPQLDQRWVGCAPSKPGLRGYPCSLWTLFHSLTVASYNADEQDTESVPRAMEAYITNFFSCVECRKNFIKEIIDSPYEDGLTSNKDVVLWLWELHNKVNKRLHGAISEDPNIQKVQFPPVKFCYDCQNSDGDWNRDKVFEYLVQRYSASQVSSEFLNTKLIAEKPIIQNKGRSPSDIHWDDGKDFVDEYYAGEIRAKLEDHDFDTEDDKNYDIKNGEAGQGHPHLVKELLQAKNKEHPMDVLIEFGGNRMAERDIIFEKGWHNTNLSAGFTYFEKSLCIVLWGTSIIAVSLLYIYMRRRQMARYCKV